MECSRAWIPHQYGSHLVRQTGVMMNTGYVNNLLYIWHIKTVHTWNLKSPSARNGSNRVTTVEHCDWSVTNSESLKQDKITIYM